MRGACIAAESYDPVENVLWGLAWFGALLLKHDGTTSNRTRVAGPPEPEPPLLFDGHSPDVDRLRDDPAYRQAYEDWLDRQENLRRDPREARRTDLLFVGGCLIATAILAALVWWLVA